MTTRLKHLVLLTMSLTGLTFFTGAASLGATGGYTVHLSDGTTLESRYLPVAADENPEVTQIFPTKGRWIAVQTRDIVDVKRRGNQGDRSLTKEPRFLGWMWVEDIPVREKIPTEENLVESSPFAVTDDAFESLLGPRALDPDDAVEGIPLTPYSTGTWFYDFSPGH